MRLSERTLAGREIIIPMQIDEQALLAAGFALAHALWSISDLEDGLLVPLAIVRSGSQPKLFRYEGATQQEAIETGKRATAGFTASSETWAFARDGVLRDEEVIDVISVDCWAPGMIAPVTLIQRYVPFTRNRRFQLIGGIQLVVDGTIVREEAAEPAIKIVREGLLSHFKVAELFPTWQ